MSAKFGVLGPLQITDLDGRWLRLRGDRLRSLLAMLLFHANKQVPTERLVDALWPDVPPKSYASNLHTYVSRLRERLGPIDNTGQGYRLRVEDDDLDLLVFRREAAMGRATRDPRAASAHLRRALAQWRDQPLADLTVPPLDAEVARLEAERFAVFEDCAEAELAAGRHADLVGELQAAVAEHPLRERLVGLLMTALWRSGRQVEALDVFRRTRATLIEETGLEPGGELREVHAAILRGEEETQAWPIRQLPAEVLDFAGRHELVGELTTVLADRRAPVVVLSGQPGVGKSMLAVRVAHRVRDAFPDGQLFAHLAGATEPREVGEVLADVLRTLGVTGPAIPDDLHAKAAVLRSRLADRKVLLVLDDAAAPGQIGALLPGTASSAVLVTSRRRLSGLAGAYRVTVPPFTGAEAAELLERVAGTRVGGDPAGAERIAAACGNLPLALRIAATRLSLRPQLRLGELADRLADERRRLDELAVSDLQVRPGLALSYAALSEPARYLFRLVGMVDVGDHPAWSLAVLLAGPVGEAAVEELVESSMLQPAGVDACGEPRFVMHDIVRAYATELAHELAGLPEREEAGTRLVYASFALTDRLVRLLPRVSPLPPVAEEVPLPVIHAETMRRMLAEPEAWFATERVALVAGICRLCRVDEFCDGQYVLAAEMFDRVAGYLWLHGYYADLRQCADALVEAARASRDEHVEARAEAVLARLLHVRGRYAEAVVTYRWCAERLVRFDDRRTGAWVLTNLADCLTGLGEPDEALRLADRAAALFPDDDQVRDVAVSPAAGAKRDLAVVSNGGAEQDFPVFPDGDRERDSSVFRDISPAGDPAVFSDSGVERDFAVLPGGGVGRDLAVFADGDRGRDSAVLPGGGVGRDFAVSVDGDRERDFPVFRDGDRRRGSAGFSGGGAGRGSAGFPDGDPERDFAVISVLRTRSAALNRLGRPAEAVLIDTEALAVARRGGDPRTVAPALQNLSWSLALTGDLDRAAVVAADAVSLLRGTTARSSLARSLRTLGAIHAGQGRRDLAVAAFTEGRRIAQEINERPRELSCARAIAASLVGEGRAAAAIPELRRCLAAYREMGSEASAAVTLRLLAAAQDATGDPHAATTARDEADRLADPRDASTTTLTHLLSTLTTP